MEFKYTLQETLEARFTDPDEMKDIANHGANCGWHGFIYTYEIEDFFNQFEDELEDWMTDTWGLTWMAEVVEQYEITSISELKQHIVWSYVECWCAIKVDECEEAAIAV